MKQLPATTLTNERAIEFRSKVGNDPVLLLTSYIANATLAELEHLEILIAIKRLTFDIPVFETTKEK